MRPQQAVRASAWVAALLAASLVSYTLLDRLGYPLFRPLRDHPALFIPQDVIVVFGKAWVLILLLIAVWLAGILRRDRRFGQACARGLLAILISGVAAHALKILVNRPRPYIPDYRLGDLSGGYYHSFPSADAAAVAAFVFALSSVFPRARVPLFGAGAVVATFRVFRLAHWPSDVLAGAALGIAGVALARVFLAARQPAARVAPEAQPDSSAA